jgi:hypothetical protein
MTAVRRKREQTAWSTELEGTLDQAGTLLAKCISADSPLTTRMSGLRDRLVGERLQLAVLGQFKRGKSTFLNALLGAPLLPTAVVPLTAVATFISWGAEPLVRIFFDARAPEEFVRTEPSAIRLYLHRFVAEEANPHNRLGVARAELFYPAPILATGTVLIDMPGIGSTLTHNTDAALKILPECDAALFIVSADPPITEVELRYLQTLRSKVTRLFFVLNKADYLQPDEQRSFVDFLRKALLDSSLFDATSPIFCVSALRGLTAKQSNDHAELEGSGIASLEEHLVHYLATEKTQSLESAVRSKATEILSQAKAELDLSIGTLQMPLEQLTSKSRAFEEALRSIEEQRLITSDLLAGDKRRLCEKLESTIELLRTEASIKLAAVIDDSLADARSSEWHEAAQSAVATEIEQFFDSAREELSRAFAADMVSVLATHQDRIDGLVEQVQRTAAAIFDVAFARHGDRETFELGEDPYWVTGRIGTSLIPDASRVIDRLLPVKVRRARVRARLVRQVSQLVVRNAENLRWAILRGLDETFWSAAARLEERLDGAIAATRGVIRQALVRRQDRSFAVRPEIERFTSAQRSLTDLLRDLSDRRGKGATAARQPLPREARSD